MRELAAQAVLLARSFEVADPEGVLLSDEDRRAATEEGRTAGGAPEQQAESRADAVLRRVDGRLRAIGRVRTWTRISPALGVPVVLASFVVGLSTNALGPSRQINLLAFPLLALLSWNVGVYVALAVAGLARAARSTPGFEPAVDPGRRPTGSGGGTGLLSSLVWWAGEWTLERVRTPDPAQAEVVSRGLMNYWSAWSQASLALGIARLRSFLHLGAAALATGVVVGMYVRGLGLEYRAMWESTFLAPEMVAGLLRFVLGPAAKVLGMGLPDARGLVEMAAPGGTPAAPWIHLWALTTAGVVVVPRVLLASLQILRAVRLGRAVGVDPLGGPFRALLPADRGAGIRVDIFPYSHRLGGRPRETLHALVADLLGSGARIDDREPVVWGTDGVHDAAAGGPHCVLVVFGLVQSPEGEVHGRYLEEWMTPGGETRLLAVIDASSWRERFGPGQEQREADRRRAWDRILREVGLTALHVDLGQPLAPEAVEQAEQALWPESAITRAVGGR